MDPTGWAAIRKQLRTDPEAVPVGSLLAPDDVDTASGPERRRLLDTLARVHPRPATLVQSALDSGDRNGATDRRHLCRLLLSCLRANPEPVARALCSALDDPRTDVRFAATEVLAFTVEDCWGLFRSEIPAIRPLLADEDPRVRAQAAAILASLARPYPDAVEPAVSDAIAMLEEPPISTSAFVFREHQPVGRALDLLAGVARYRHETIRGAVPPATRILREDDQFVEQAVAFLRQVARSSPDAVGTLAWLPDRAAQLTGEKRVAVLDLAHFVGVYDGAPEPIERPERAVRDVQLTAADREYLEALDDETAPSPDVARLLPHLRATSEACRRTAARVLFGPRTEEQTAAIQAHAGEFLALLDEQDDVTRSTLESVLGPVVAQHAPEWLPALVDIARTGTTTERRVVSSLLSVAARTYPSGVREDLDVVLEFIEQDRDSVAAIHASWTLYHVAVACPGAVRPVFESVLKCSEANRGITASTTFELLGAFPDDADVLAPPLQRACRDVADDLDEPPAGGIFDVLSPPIDRDPHAPPEGLCQVLKAVALLAVLAPQSVEPVRPDVTRIAESVPGQREELDRARLLSRGVLAELDGEPVG